MFDAATVSDYATGDDAWSAPAQRERGLSALEWRVVSLAIREARACGCANVLPASLPMRIATGLFTLLTGRRPVLPLGDAKLEALRRFVCLCSWKHRAADEAGAALLDYGFSRAQCDAIATIARR